MTPQWPKRLQRGDTIRIMAPSGAFDRDRFDAGIAIIQSYGVHPIVDAALFTREGYFAGNDAHRLGVLQTALRDRRAKAIWAARGGYGASRLLSNLDDPLIASHGGWLIGFSDITALHARWQRLGSISMHAANVTTLSTWNESARDELFRWLMADTADAMAGEAIASPWQGITISGADHATVRGRLLGGNLTVLASLVGTGALPSFHDAMLFVEDTGEKPYRLDRCLSQLCQSGALRGLRAMVIGQLTECGDSYAASCAALLNAAHGGLGTSLPIVAGLPFGHDACARAVPLGAMMQLEPASGVLTMVATPHASVAHVGA